MAQRLLDALKRRVEIKGAAVFKRHFDLDVGVLGGDAAAGDGEEDALPDVGAEEGGGDVGVLEGQDGSGEGLEGGGGGGGEVDELLRSKRGGGG